MPERHQHHQVIPLTVSTFLGNLEELLYLGFRQMVFPGNSEHLT